MGSVLHGVGYGTTRFLRKHYLATGALRVKSAYAQATRLSFYI
ncbi:hypothetical protein GCM10007939_15200 [Amylibacter marinus]|uniref:Uncharacterized protein n=1 Tax=Amylibacter marinus TaxID=1475483 RepID=A0ABQ5VVN1_9RHOB|nr:hypothetical protein GCM10007939_15200 [Amylibacter marinus]